MAKEATTFTIKHSGAIVSISTEDKLPDALSALLRTVFHAFKKHPKQLEQVVSSINRYHAIISAGDKLPKQEPIVEDYDYFNHLLQQAPHEQELSTY